MDLKRIFKYIVFNLILACLVLYACKLLERDESAKMKGKFWRAGSETDVLVLGTSHALYGVDPKVMEDEGVPKVFNLAGYAQRIPTSYWILVNALDYCKPSIVVLDIYPVENSDKYAAEHKDYLHMSADAIPFSIHKVQMMRDILEDDSMCWEFLADFYLYHNRWDSISLSNFNVISNSRVNLQDNKNGCIRSLEVVASESPRLVSDEGEPVPNTVGMEYLEKIYELCKQENIQLILTNIPYQISESAQQNVFAIGRWAKEREISLYNMICDDDIEIDFSTDFTDENAIHLNVYGQEKVSKALARYIIQSQLEGS